MPKEREWTEEDQTTADRMQGKDDDEEDGCSETIGLTTKYIVVFLATLVVFAEIVT